MRFQYAVFAALCLSLIQSPLQSFENQPEGGKGGEKEDPWFTGPLLAPSSGVVPKGHVMVQPYLFVTRTNAIYDRKWDVKKIHQVYTVAPQLVAIAGITDKMDIRMTPQAFYNKTQSRSSGNFGDLPIGIDYLAYTAPEGTLYPAIKLQYQLFLPTGNYQRLNPHKRGTDISGFGTYTSEFGIVICRQFQISGVHWLSVRFGNTYAYNPSVHVSGFNSYGGGYHTKGTVKPGNEFSSIFSFEYSFTKNWAFALDTLYVHKNNDHFHGRHGKYADGSKALVGLPSSEQISFAPAIEYNFSSYFGVIGGVWFTAWGRNSAKFMSGAISAIYTW